MRWKKNGKEKVWNLIDDETLDKTENFLVLVDQLYKGDDGERG